ncbi:PH domain-containing protein [Gillisia sp. CAL575]|uniref:PH domain-containing protein n=1 Tax=Gillisia sp. CAL575 TaxID=985255 RepID=UPI0018DC083C|nr:PH domain-containing protein [Gillisia sp. CAL575]
MFGPLLFKLSDYTLNTQRILGILLLLVTFALILHMFLTTIYTIDNDKLKIKSGFFSYKPIEISEIKSITKTNNIISSPAASFDRIEIQYGKFKSIVLSPKDKSNFCKDLNELNPEIKIVLN